MLLCALALGIDGCAVTAPHFGDLGSPDATAKVPLSTAAPAVTINPNLGADGKLTTGQNYVIGPEDLLKIEVYGAENMNRTLRVNASGQIVLPLIGLVQAAGLTSEQLAGEIAARLGKDYMQNPQVIVYIEQYTSQRVTVVGAVNSSGVYPLKGRATLVQAIASAGGPSKIASKSVKIMRAKPDGTRTVMAYNLKDIQDGRVPDPEIRGEDMVLVETSLYKDTFTDVFQWILPLTVIMSFL